MARAGNPIRKAARRIRIEKIDILDMDLPHVNFEVTCSAGTYIRTLAADIGEFLGCGAHLDQLRRMECCGFGIEKAITLKTLEQLAGSGEVAGCMVGMSDALPKMAEHVAENGLIEKVRHGAAVTTADISPPQDGSSEGLVKIVDATGGLVAVLNRSPDSVKYQYCCVF